MRILFVVDSLGAGGSERSLQELLPAFVSAGVTPVVACLYDRAEGVANETRQACEVHLIARSGRVPQMVALRRIARDGRFDLAHTTLFESDVYGRTALLGTGIPIVTSLVNMPYEPCRLVHDPNLRRLRLLGAQGLDAATSRLASHFHAVTEAVKQAAVRRLRIPEARITVVHRGRNPARLGRRSQARRERIRRALGLPADAFVVLNAARQEFQKGQRFLIDALARVRVPNCRLVIAGRNGHASSLLRDSASQLAPGTVSFLGHRDDVADLMTAADVFVLPSIFEGTAGVLIEAMALELPIVASDLACLHEVVEPGRSALLVPSAQPAAIAEAIETLAVHPDLGRQLAERARLRFESAFTLDRSARGMLEVFERVVSERTLRRLRHAS